MTDISERHTDKESGKWKTFNNGGKDYLKIITPNEKFNDTYEIINYQRVLDSASYGYLNKVTLKSKRLTLYCRKAEYAIKF